MEYFKQEKDYTCGCACVRMVMSHVMPSVSSESDLEHILETDPNKGTDPKKIEEFFKANGCEVISKNDSTVDEIQKLYEEGWAVMLAISVDVPHFTVYDGHNGNHVRFFDPYFGIIHRTIKNFMSDNMNYPHYRWRVVPEEFKKHFPQYDFEGKQSNKYFLAVRKK